MREAVLRIARTFNFKYTLSTPSDIMPRMNNHHDNAPQNDNKTGNMKGFDSEFTDIVDYILRITYRIWEGKQVGLCHDYYSEDCPVYTLAGMTIGAAEVTQNTLDTLAAYPDRTLHADNIIWGGNDIDGFHTSHLISTSMTNLGDTEYGKATGKHAKIQVIAHCVIKDNRIIEEWLVRDNFSLVEQLGYDPHEIAMAQSLKMPTQRYQEWHDSELVRVSANVNSQRSVADKSDLDKDKIISTLQNIWNARMIGDVYQTYSPTAKLHASANREFEGQDSIAEFYLSFLGTFSDLKMSLDYSCQTPSKSEGMDVAIRWTMTGNHTGNKLYGKASNENVLIIGESQYHVIDGKIVEEWTVFDELATLAQIYRARN